jgi:DHA3 family multidrug efflux protein-like MFS transporter
MLATTAPVATEVPDGMATFRRLLVNTLVSGVTSSFLWFALTFWVYLETGSVVATAVIGAAFALSSAVFGPAYGTYVDTHRKHAAMVLSTSVSAACFAIAAVLFMAVDEAHLLDMGRPWFWVLVGVSLLGSVAGQMRGIALSTCVTLLVPERLRDRANGMVGTVTGISFAVTSVFSGLVIGHLGMGWAIYGSLALTVVALTDLVHLRVPEPAPDRSGSDGARIDIRGAIEAIRAVPGLWMLIGLAAFNNLLAGVFMSLTDAYGLSLVSVETWGLLFGFISLAFIAGGIVVAKVGLGRSPLRVILVGNLVNWTTCVLFPVWDSIIPLVLGMTVWLALIPAIEAAEQTVLQRAIPFERQGRVFGFAQLVENAAAPVTALAMGPLAESVFMPSADDGWIADTIGSWWGTGAARGLAVMFTLAGLVGVVVTVVALGSRAYRRLAKTVDEAVSSDGREDDAPEAPCLVPQAA